MPFAAVISATANIGHDAGPLRAMLVFSGQTLVEYQARQAAEAGAGHISIHVGAVTPALSRSVDRLTADGINVSLVRSTAELRQTVPLDTDILLVGDGILAAPPWFQEIAQRPAPVVLVLNDHVTRPEFERIDAQHRWAGLARLNYRQLVDTLDRLDVLTDWDLQSTLLRHAVQSNGDRILVDDEALFNGGLFQLESQDAADAAEHHFLPARPMEQAGTGWVDRYVFRSLADKLVPLLSKQQIEPAPVRVSAAAIALIGLIIATNGITWPALLLFLVALAAQDVAVGLAGVVRRPSKGAWPAYICSAIALLGLAVLGGNWRVGDVRADFTGLYLVSTILIVELTIRTGRAQGLNPWALCSLATATFLLLLFRLAGALELGFAFVILYALGSMATIILRRDTTPESPASAK
ncbi:hypothetical protein [Rhizorhapis suberifaciens]|uniref:Uncharacterized protein n=1 Tax=Rhizorhapis suberifaciens TaxID=13656 RepID=A0A840HWF1_9SPHN|nr:hypothetical protein [Rhizorhapis suberifaciens]MBB4642395.1 hypothetical protein [Rhizorhapis suberifaciens]